MANVHKLGDIEQRDDEVLARVFSAAALTSTPAVVSCGLLDISNPGSPVDASDLLSGTATVSGTSVTTQLVGGLTEGKKYRLKTIVSDGGSQRWTRYYDITCTGDND